jgi:hypothetical protein
VLGCLAVVGFTLSCVALEGSGHPCYLFSGWIISVPSICALVWWWV